MRLTPPMRLAGAALAAGTLAVAVVVATSGGDGYRVRIPLASATGLEDGSSVQIGGIDRGRVELSLEKGDRVVATVELQDGAGPVGRNASASIEAANFLGRKRVNLRPGDAAGNPAPSGWTMPADRVSTPTDLDQLLGVFDADTRTRAQVLLNEMGTAVVGRRVDIRKLLEEFPAGLESSTAVLQDLRTDDATMHDLLTRSDRIVDTIARQRQSLGDLVDTVGQTAETVSARRTELRDTLARAPGMLRSLRGFLGDLQATTGDLGPAARELETTAPPLGAALRELDGFRRAAGPTLRLATAAAPQLTRLADGVTPVARRALPSLQALSTLGGDMVPVSNAVDGSADNVIAVLENWSRAIQFRDGLSHVFRGEASFSPDLILSAVHRLTTEDSGGGHAASPARGGAQQRSAPAADGTPGGGDGVIHKLADLPKALHKALDALPAGASDAAVEQAVGDVVTGLSGVSSGDRSGTRLLDFLLGP
jgi:phospholipid/cholesterol/gamma-HCH transport system substrate-binding protein